MACLLKLWDVELTVDMSLAGTETVAGGAPPIPLPAVAHGGASRPDTQKRAFLILLNHLVRLFTLRRLMTPDPS